MQNEIEGAMSRTELLLKESTMHKRAQREMEIRLATQQLHVEAGRDPNKALDPCSREEFERINAHAQMVSQYHRKQAEQVEFERIAACLEKAQYEKYQADLAKYKADRSKEQQQQ